MIEADFLFDENIKTTPQDAYVLGNLFSYNYIDSVNTNENKFASFISKKKRPQKSNSTGFEYTEETFSAYKESLITFFANDKKYLNIDIKILWDNDVNHDGVFIKRKGERILFFNLSFTIYTDYREILTTIRKKINSLELFIWFFRGIIDTRGSIDKTTKKIAVDMDTHFSSDQAKEIFILSEKYFKDINKFTNYNPRNNQPSKTSRAKNPQLRPSLKHYLEKVGTINPQFIYFYDYLFNEKWELKFSQDGEFFIYNDLHRNPKGKQKNKINELKIDDRSRVRKILKNPKNSRKTLNTETKIDIWSNKFNEMTIDGENIDFVLIEWHHAVPNRLKNLENYLRFHEFIDNKNNFVPLSSAAHNLIHKGNHQLTKEKLEEKNKLIGIINVFLNKYIKIELEELMEIYK